MKDLIYNHRKIEEKWQETWEEQALFQDSAGGDPAQKLYLLFAFAYPSGSGLHVGHVESKTALDILARFNRMRGKDVFFPVGWDAFGLPAENYAIKTGVPPAVTTQKAMATFQKQLKRIGISYDWANEIATCFPDYYQWTQWLFLELFKAGLAYQAEGKVNWCPSCQTVLANEQVISGLCERCDHEVTQKEMKQWYFKITDYKDELIEGLDKVDWPEPTKQQQINWIGRSEGVEIGFKIKSELGTENFSKDVASVKNLSVGDAINAKSLDAGDVKNKLKKNGENGGEHHVENGENGIKNGENGGENGIKNGKISEEIIKCFTTRLDTIFGVSFVVLSPEKFIELKLENKLANQFRISVLEYVAGSLKKTEEERKIGEKKKTGVDTGLKVINPVSGQEIPIWVADYVLAGYGTGAVMGVPAHDKRDKEFAQKFGLEITKVIEAETETAYGTLLNSGKYNGLTSKEATKQIVADFSEQMVKTKNYRLRDWLISRQRYWGTPIPIIYDPEGQSHPVKKESLPWKLPEDVDFKPTGESPLRSSQEFLARTQQYAQENFAQLIKEKGWNGNGEGWVPEYDTMDTFVDSSWYYLRYCDAKNTQEFASSSQLDKWLPVDFYMIGPEHIVLHLLYSRFFTKFLADQKYLDFREPFVKMRHQGMILGPDGKKMSKSKGNVINPDDVVEKFGADTLRVYEMFMGPIEADKPWDDRSVVGIHRFLRRIYQLVCQTAKMSQGKSGVSANLVGENKGGESRVSANLVGENKGGESRVSANLVGENSLGEIQTTSLEKLQRKLQQTIKKVSADIPALKFNTAIASMMEFLNAWEAQGTLNREDVSKFVRILAPFAPFMAEELWQELAGINQTESVHLASWPDYDPELVQDEIKRIPVQVNGKLRSELVIDARVLKNLSKEKILTKAKKLPQVAKWLGGREPKKEIYIVARIINLVI